MNQSQQIMESLDDAKASPLKKFIQANADELDAKIKALPAFKKQSNQVLNDITRSTWVMNSEELRDWIRSKGVKI